MTRENTPKIEDLLFDLRQAEKAADEMARALRTAERRVTNIKKDIITEVASILPGNIDPRTIGWGHWDCETSPTGKCMYDFYSDTAEDECLFCGQLAERK